MINLGQYFTPDAIVDQMISLIENNGSILEPSCGNGAFLHKLPKHAIGIEIDSNFTGENILNIDFFDYNPVEKFDTIIGNPPYVKYQEIYPETLHKLPNILDKRSNLYLFFMWKSIDLLKDNGELIFIVPRDFLKTTSARPLNIRFIQEGCFTYFHEFGDEKIFTDASPNVCIFRWVKNLQANNAISVYENNGYLQFKTIQENTIPLSELFDIKTGGVTGCNEIYYQPFGNIDLVVSSTKRTGKTQKAILATSPTDYLLTFKDRLLNRKVRSFNENNWFEWGRKLTALPDRHIYVNCKTRDMQPFFYHPVNYHDGSLLALICKESNQYDLDYLIYCLNNNNWDQQGFQVGGRLIFGQRNLSNAYLILR